MYDICRDMVPVTKGVHGATTPVLHVEMPARSKRGRQRQSCTASVKEAGSMALWPTAGIWAALKANMAPRLGLGKDTSTCTVSWGGSIESIQPTGALSGGRGALWRMGLALTDRSRLMEGRALRGDWG